MPTVLRVDDDELVRKSLARMVEGAGHLAWEAADGRVALEMLRFRKFDVVVLDLVMPEIDGLELIRTVTIEHPNIRLVAISGGCFGNTNYLKAAASFGAHAVLEKPFRRQELLDAICRRSSASFSHTPVPKATTG